MFCIYKPIMPKRLGERKSCQKHF